MAVRALRKKSAVKEPLLSLFRRLALVFFIADVAPDHLGPEHPLGFTILHTRHLSHK
jgi:hypothetical protein